jgi:predicted ATPase/DNA-binding SARP family transcriptional activator
MALQIAILGSVEPRINGDVVGLPGGKQRALLTWLAMRAPRSVSAESAAEALWPHAAPEEAIRNLHVTVSRLRRSLAAAGSALETVASGYRLAVEADAIDARRFEKLTGEARAARVEGDAAAARRLLDDALGLWRGPALADVGFESFAQAEIARLEELRLAALEERIDARLSLGEHALVVGELEQLSGEHPSRERLVGLLMLALYRCGRQTDALDVYTRGRLRLDEELGLEPSPELQRLQEAILRHDPSLDAPVPGDRDARPASIDHWPAPEGVVTMLFTDIEGSTRLARAAGSLWPQLLAEHHRLVLDAVERAGGHLDGSEGDALFAYFVDPSAAVEAAIAAQHALRHHAWPEPVPDLRVRMGIHAGLVSRADTGYSGLQVHLAARVTAAGHGGQVVVSAAARALLGSQFELVDVGEHRLKDFPAPERLWLLVCDDRGPGDFPPLRTEPVRPTHLPAHPAPGTRLIGRERELRELIDMICAGDARLVSLVGPGGVGKTRLALELADAAMPRFRDGAAWVELAAAARADHVPGTIARALAATQLGGETPEQALLRLLEDRQLLLVLDNFEHVLDAAPLVADLLAATSRLRVLVTSREPLRLRTEQLFRLDPLALPQGGIDGDGTSVEEAPAVALFLAVARARDPSFALGDENAEAVARVCQRLDGLPLAIELAAARIGLLTVSELAARLRDGLDALGTGPRDAPARQRTLAATLEWSYALLTADERAALAGLAVFAGGCTVEAAQAVTGASLDVLEALLEKSLIVRRPAPNEASRLTLLETVADFARARVGERRDAAEFFERHFDHYLAFAERAACVLERTDAPALMAELDREIHNLRAALDWALDRHAAPRALRLATAVTEYWDVRDLHEGARWLRDALALPHENVALTVQAAALGAYARCLGLPRTFDEAESAARESIELARSSGDLAQCAASMTTLAAVLMLVDRSEEGHHYASEAERLAREARDEPKHATALELKALTAPTLSEALALGEQAAAAYRREGGYRRLATLQSSLAYNALVHGDADAAERLTPEALRLAESIGDSFVMCFTQGNLGLVMLLTHDSARASLAFTRELQLAIEHRYEPNRYEAIHGMAGVAAARGEDELAATLLAAAEAGGPERHPAALERQLEERYFGPARERLGERAWRAAQATGAALTPSEAADAALRARRIASPASG